MGRAMLRVPRRVRLGALRMLRAGLGVERRSRRLLLLRWLRLLRGGRRGVGVVVGLLVIVGMITIRMGRMTCSAMHVENIAVKSWCEANAVKNHGIWLKANRSPSWYPKQAMR